MSASRPARIGASETHGQIEVETIGAEPGAGLDEALGAREQDHVFLPEGGVITEDLIETWIEHMRKEADRVRLRPDRWELALYFDV